MEANFLRIGKNQDKSNYMTQAKLNAIVCTIGVGKLALKAHFEPLHEAEKSSYIF